MNEFPANLWAPWRMEYIHAIGGDDDACFFCQYRDKPENDRQNHVLWRSDNAFVMLNRFPYTNGHLLIAPLAHKADLNDLPPDEMQAIWLQTREAKNLLTAAVAPHGFNIGINFGRCAGAGVPGHLHIHVVPRWNGDTNFMAVLGDVRVVPQSLDALYGKLTEIAAAQGLPRKDA